MTPTRWISVAFLLASAVLVSSNSMAGDWPQILGPARSGTAASEKLPEKWPPGGPKKLWAAKLGSGYAGPAVVGDQAIVFHRMEDKEVVESFDARTGRSQWKTSFPALYRGGIDPDIGPRCVPVVAGDSVFVFGAAGDLHAVSLTTGKARWSRSLYADYKGDEGYFGAGSTPLVIGGKVLVNVGGRGAGIVALEAATGKTVWKATDEAASYSSPVKVTVGGQEQALFITRMNCVLANPESGNVQTLFPFGKRGPTVNAATPLVFGNNLFVTASYGVGGKMCVLEGSGTKQQWADDETLSSQYATPVQQNGFLYGTHGREDQGVAELRCVEAATGKVKWAEKDFGVAHVILADGKLLLLKVDGHLILAAAVPEQFKQLASAEVPGDITRALPALSNGRLYIRTGSGGGELVCLSVGQ